MTASGFDPSQYTLQHASDPNASYEVLAAIAYYRPDLRAAVASNPAAHEELLNWFGLLGDPSIDAIVAQRRAQSRGQEAAVPLPPFPPDSPPMGGGNVGAGYAGAGYGGGYAAGGYAAGGYAGAGFAGDNGAVAYGGYGADYSTGNVAPGSEPGVFGVPEEVKRRRKWSATMIALVSCGALVLGAGAVAGYVLWNKSRGSKSPVAAADKLLESAVNGIDLVGLYGSVSHDEREALELLYGGSVIDDADDGNGTVSTMKNIAGIFRVTGDKIEFSEDQKLGDLVSRVRLDSAELTIDVDSEALLDEVERAIRNAGDGGLSSTLLYSATGGHTDYVLEQLRSAQTRDALRDVFPLDISVGRYDTVIRTNSGESETFSTPITLVTAKESSGWFVSPLLTIADYALAEANIAPGRIDSLLADESGADSSAAAVQAAATAFEDFWTSGDPSYLYPVLPVAERRVTMFIAPAIEQTYRDYTSWSGPLPRLSIDLATSPGGDARGGEFLLIDDASVTVGDETVRYRNGCVDSVEGDRACLTDLRDQVSDPSAIPGPEDIGLVTIKQAGRWYVSAPATVGQALESSRGLIAELARQASSF